MIPGPEDPLEKEMATRSSVLAREIPWTKEAGGLQSMELERHGYNLVTKQQQQINLQPILHVHFTFFVLRTHLTSINHSILCSLLTIFDTG